jgi:hypothetical protein
MFFSIASGKIDISANADAFTAVPRAYLPPRDILKNIFASLAFDKYRGIIVMKTASQVVSI